MRSGRIDGRRFEEVAEELMTWRMHELAGLEVTASTPRADQDSLVLPRWGIGRAAWHIPCRVVYTAEEPRRVGFACGTLPGHQESGEEIATCGRWRPARARASRCRRR